MDYIIPILIFFLLLFAVFKRVNVYNAFCEGAKNGLILVFDIFPYICAILLLVGVMRASGVTLFLSQIISPFFHLFGIPNELAEFILLRPFSGSGSLGLLEDIFKISGVNSTSSDIASIIMGSSETVFFVSSVYFAKTYNVKNTVKPICIALTVSFVGILLSCFFVKLFF